jgi:hypothetical protein
MWYSLADVFSYVDVLGGNHLVAIAQTLGLLQLWVTTEIKLNSMATGKPQPFKALKYKNPPELLNDVDSSSSRQRTLNIRQQPLEEQ